jgi:hypothetical protein
MTSEKGLTQGADSTTLLDDASSGRVVDSLVVGLDTPAPGIVRGTVGGILGSLVEAVERARGEVVTSALGSDEAGSDSGKGQERSLHLGGSWFGND